MALVWNWKFFWLKVDSALILDLFLSSQLVRWELRVEWRNDLLTITGKGIKQLILLRTMDPLLLIFVWWDSPSTLILPYFHRDYVGLPSYPFRYIFYCLLFYTGGCCWGWGFLSLIVFNPFVGLYVFIWHECLHLAYI